MTLNAAYLDGTGYVSTDGTEWILASAATPLPVTLDGSITVGNINLTEVGGTAIAAGPTTPANALPVQQALPNATINFGGTSTGSTSQLASNAITQGAFIQNTGSGVLYIGGSGVTADAGNSTSGTQLLPASTPGAGGQGVLFGNNTNLTYVIGSSTYAVTGA